MILLIINIVIMMGSSPNLLRRQEAALGCIVLIVVIVLHNHHCQHKIGQPSQIIFLVAKPSLARSFYRRVARPKNQPQAILYSLCQATKRSSQQLLVASACLGGCIDTLVAYLFDFSSLCVFKCPFKSPLRKDS